MKNICKIISLLIAVCTIVGCFVSCDIFGSIDEPSNEPSNDASSSAESDNDLSESSESTGESNSEGESKPSEVTTSEQAPPSMEDFVDYAAQLKLDMNDTETLKQEVTVKTFIDGDTTHFIVPTSVMETGLLKARYLAIDTPESTGKIEEWGKRASRFTKEKLQSATSIIVESDTNEWNSDSTGGRYMVWVWYKTADSTEYRNLNLEILQNGLAVGSNAGGNRYGKTCLNALAQASKYKLYVHSGEKDPDYPYGEANEVTLSELRYNIKDYDGKKVAFEGIITKSHENSIYIEEYDEPTGIYNGISVFLGYNLPGKALEMLSVGNRVRVVGTIQYYDAGETYQLAGLSYKMMKPNDPDNIKLIETGHTGAFTLTDPKKFAEGKVAVDLEDEEGNVTTKEFAYGELVMNTSISMNGLQVTDIYTTNTPGGTSNGAMTLTCKATDGTIIKVRTEVLLDADGKIVTESAYLNKNINVRGIVDYFAGSYQIKVFSTSDITFN